MTNLDWATLVKERDEWDARNFPPYRGEIPGNDSILGCIEELGELTHAYLKRKQGIRGTVAEHDEAAKDAIGDITVYLLGVISVHVPVGQLTLVRTGHHPQSQDATLFLLSLEVGYLGGCAAGSISTSWYMAVNNILKYLEMYCDWEGWSFDVIVQGTWDHVKLRDWNAHRADGAAKDDPAMKDPVPDISDL